MRRSRLSPLLISLLCLAACAPVSGGTAPPTSPTTVASPVPANTFPAERPSDQTAQLTQLTAAPSAPAPTNAPTMVPTIAPVRTPLSALSSWGLGVPSGAAYSPDGNSFAVATAARLELRDSARPAQRIWGIDLPAAAGPLAFAPDGAIIALAVGQAVELRSATDGSLRATLPADAPVADLAFGPEGATLAAAAGPFLRIWELPGEAPVRDLVVPEGDPDIGPPGDLTSVALGPDGQLAVGGDTNGNVLIWRVADGELAQAFSVGLRVVADVALAPDGITVAAASEGWRGEPGAAWLWDIASGGEPRILTIDDGDTFLAPATRVAFGPDGSEIALGAADGTLARWSLPSGELMDAAGGHRAAVVALEYARNDGALLSAGRDGEIHIHTAKGLLRGKAALAPAVSAVALTPSGDLAAAGGEDGTITLIEPDGTAAGQIEAHKGPVGALAISPDGALLISAGDDGVARLWSLPDGAPRGQLLGHTGPVLGVAVSPDGARLATAGWDGTVRVWKLPGGEAERTITVSESDGFSSTAILDIAISPDSAALAAASSGGEVRLYGLTDGDDRGELIMPGGVWVLRAAYAPGGGLLAALDENGQVIVWGPDGEPLGTAKVPGAADLAWVGERVLATAGGERGAQLWALGDGPLVALAAAPTSAESLAVAPGEGRLCLGSRAGTVELRALR